MNRSLALLAVLTFASSVAFAQAVQIISPDEAKLPPMPEKAGTRSITRGPGVKILSPETVTGNFPFKVGFEPRGGSTIDPASVKIEYMKGNGIDLTGRMKSAIKPDGIELANVSAPAGEHAIRIQVKDSEGRQGEKLMKLVVK